MACYCAHEIQSFKYNYILLYEAMIAPVIDAQASSK